MCDFRQVAAKQVNDEMKGFARSEWKTRQDLTMDNIHKFSWEDFLSDAQALMPLMVTVLSSAVQKRDRKKDILDSQMAKLMPSIGHMLTIILFKRLPSSFKFVPSLTSLQLFRHGNPHMVSTKNAQSQMFSTTVHVQ